LGAQYVDFLERTVEAQDRKIAAVNSVIINIEKTIAGKQKLLDNLRDYSGGLVNDVTARFLEINIDELTKILHDLKRING